MRLWIRLVGALLFVAASSLYGWMQAGNLFERRKELEYLSQMLTLMKSEVSFGRSSLGEIFFLLSKKSKTPYRDIFQTVYERLESGREEFDFAWQKALEEVETLTCLKEEDLSDLMGLTELSAAMDVRFREEIFGQVFSRIEEKTEQLKEEYRQKGKIYCCMGVTIGILGVIILI